MGYGGNPVGRGAMRRDMMRRLLQQAGMLYFSTRFSENRGFGVVREQDGSAPRPRADSSRA